MESPSRFDTQTVTEPDTWPYGDVVPPIHLSSTFAQPAFDPGMRPDDLDPDEGEYLYGRIANPTRHAVESRLAGLEGAADAFAFASGTAAVTTAALATLEPGDRLVASHHLYVGTRRLFDELLAEQLGVEVVFVEATDTDQVASAVDDDTRLVWAESPTNPTLRLCDLEAIGEIAHGHGAVFGVDNTFASPVFQQPLALGADLVVHSTTKYLNGHSDSIGGALMTDDSDLAERVGFHQQVALGNPLAPFDCYLLDRGLKTLGVRMRRHEENALTLARFLEDHESVSLVHHPGLESHPRHDLAREQMQGFGGTFSFELEGGVEAATSLLAALEESTVAVSLGGVETLVCHPASMTHEPLGEAVLDELGISPSLIRVSVGIEAAADLTADFATALAAVDVS